ncbi:YaiO family outer membrane beta-barrel protein [Wenyingzhuangia sp. chi5]|uniref:YaiO family outer membrane beta-barrel protein n=1 Tax=Wenyingzhuangia gilva TaxID=3057677 RepID=A0ABT8VSF9_9FLAO|nr:YaiO family outer membrane beta-barrel protein [Wenyingzhuangia sp. chi5]MDO3694908.1 YaiO family outer membrane beta-barrel protein [Wenyingzhuangia sp. chi5]
MRQNHLTFKKVTLLFIFVCCSQYSFAQDLSSDELFKQARTAAFDEDDYSKAILLSKQALEKSPDYADIRIFLGRVYTWSDKKTEARKELNIVLQKTPENEEASIALANVEFWNDNSKEALKIINVALKYHPTSIDLLLYKARLLNDIKKWSEAEEVVEQVLKQDAKNDKARAMLIKIKDNSFKSQVGVSYEYVYFDDGFNGRDPWQLASVDYSMQTPIGSVIARVNYANRFLTNGFQYEIDAYPSFSETFRAYMNIGYADASIFPKYRASFSLYADLPKSFEAEAGFRYLNFGSDTWIYTASVGKYYRSYWFNFRTYLTPSNSDLSRSFSFSTRYYYSGTDDYIGIRIGSGLSPDDSSNANLIGTSNYKLISNNINLEYRKTFKTFNVIRLTFGFENQEYKVNTRGNQIDFGISYSRRFR